LERVDHLERRLSPVVIIQPMAGRLTRLRADKCCQRLEGATRIVLLISFAG
jgi:hypothetical protein